MTEPSPGIAGLHQRIPFLLSQLGVHIADDFVVRLEPFGVGPRTFAVLTALSADDGQSQRQLATLLGIHRNAMVAVVDKLESQGLVKRTPHAQDRRAFAIRLTDKARELLPALDAQGRLQEETITAMLTGQERDALRHLLQRVSTGLGMSPGVHPRLAER
ncbi:MULTISPECIES: MarR family winged helix-turn-helix transcriptional regulator [Mycolicibacterium]|uniref:Transcriptional regulator n=1 Tax=Mycolicibacterium chitae TaxID=1792 RepID=A0A3S4SAJ9_MYCCI|nr:MarR family transcriptional regulator [Mycolicibacterium chitae]MCV7108807.1 MarR family transcriptional regulator [Mycolicibacterium chitae]VEG48791.1 transcriptional regulator [Mycolicibacterium chitae]